MNKIYIYVFISLCIVTSSNVYSQETEYDFYIKIVDQDDNPVAAGIVYYCINDCVLLRNKHNQRSAVTNAQGIAKIQASHKDYVRLQGAKKDGYDIRLENEYFSRVKVDGIEPQSRN